MPQYEFLKDSGNKKAGEIFPLSPEVAPKLLKDGTVKLVNGQEKPNEPVNVIAPNAEKPKVKTGKKKK